jgi:ssDNA-binding replication factor A large subunit
VRSFKTKKGIESKVVNLTLADETSNIRVVLWDTNHVGLVEKGEITENTSIELDNGSMRGQEVHLGSFSELKVIDKVFENVKTEKVVHEKQVSDLNIGESSSVRAFVVQAFEPNFFSICPECNKKVVQEGEGFLCKEHGKVAPEKRAVTNVVVDDGTGSIRAVLFHEKISELGINIESENLTQEKEKIMGKEMIFSGNVRNNAFFNTPELIIDSVKPVDLDKVIETLEKNAN